MYYRVFPLWRSFDDYGLVYRVSEALAPHVSAWVLVEVPFQTSSQLAVCYEEIWELQDNYRDDAVKDIIQIIDVPYKLSQLQCEIIAFMARYYIVPVHHVVSLFFPINLIEKIKKETIFKMSPKEYSYLPDNWIILSEKQEEIFIKIKSSNNLRHLLYGVTWSGKTQLYMKLIEQNLILWKQTLLLIPEIILTSQIGERIKEEFGRQVILLNSSVSAAKKTQLWIDIYSGNAKIIIGTRSALFYPYQNLGMILMDEEHDQSYISDTAPRYSTKEVAEKMSTIGHIPLILASWTPTAVSFYKALKWEYELHQLLEIYGKNKE